MSKRQLLGGAAILVVIASAVWYVAGAPARDSGMAPDASVRVRLSATAVGTGSWVRYLITVKNLADGDFMGNVLLVDQDQSRDAPQATPSLSTIASNPRLPAAPASAGQSAYQLHLAVPSRKSRTVAVLAPDFFTVVQAVMGGRMLDAQAVDHPTVIPVAVLSDVETAADAIMTLHFDRFTPRAVDFASATGFPASALQLAGYTTVIIEQFDTALLDDAQVRALRDFVDFGGTLVVAGGSGWRRTVAPLPADLLPIQPSTTGSLSLAPLAGLTGASVDPRQVPAATGSLAAGARRLLDGDGGAPLVAELPHGAGKVVELAYDPSGDGTGQTPYAALGWTQALGRSIEQVPGSNPMATSLLGPDPGFTALLPAADSAPLPPLWLMGLVLLAYVVIAGPLMYLLARRHWGRPALFWVTVPLAAATFTGAFYLVGSLLQGNLQDHEIQVVRVGSGQTVNVLEYHRVLFLGRGQHQILPAPNTLVAPLTLETFRTTGSTCERCTTVLGGLSTGAENVGPGLQPVVSESGVVYGSVRVVASSVLERAPLGLRTQLAVHGGRVQGTLTNAGSQTVWLPRLFSGDGQTLHKAELGASVAPGETIAVDAPLGAADAPSQGVSPGDVLMRSVAGSSLRVRGQVVLVGLTRPLPTRLTVDGQTPPGAALAVLEQTVALAGVDSGIRDTEDKWLAGTTGDQKSGFAAVYDLLVPHTGVPLQLTYNPQWTTAMEVYDWSRGVFVPVSAGPGGDPSASAVALAPEQMRDGMVRVRMHEPRLSWATSVWIDEVPAG
ncbi:MAG TPA: hypothetical protein VGO86_11135 [Candidatus Dormibacteraeota bacterium]